MAVIQNGVYINAIDSKFIDRMVKYFYGQTAVAHDHPDPGHIYNWAAKKPNDPKRYGVNFQQYSDAGEPYGKNWRVVCPFTNPGRSPFDKYGQQYFNPFSHNYYILPIVQVASELVFQNEKIRVACENFFHNVCAVSDFYQWQIGKGFKVAQPIAMPSQRNVQQWVDIYKANTNRYDLWEICLKDVREYFDSRINSSIIYVVTQFLGDSPEMSQMDYDAAGGSNLAVVSCFSTAWKYAPGTPSPYDETAIYALAHEIGHNFTLGHTDKNLAPSDWHMSIMQAAKPPSAILCEYERKIVRALPWFNWS